VEENLRIVLNRKDEGIKRVVYIEISPSGTVTDLMLSYLMFMFMETGLDLGEAEQVFKKDFMESFYNDLKNSEGLGEDLDDDADTITIDKNYLSAPHTKTSRENLKEFVKQFKKSTQLQEYVFKLYMEDMAEN
jgi:hypothetical protein